MAEWRLWRQRPGGERDEVIDHPLLDLWERPNPFFTQEEFVEVSQQHIDLTGESFWLIVRNAAGGPAELWPIRPDRMRIIPSVTEFIDHYEYIIGSTKIPLDTEDVIFLRMPSPLDPYRGMGPVGSIMTDVETERMAATWSRNFFRNSAEPGGIITFPDELNDDQFAKQSMRWREQHQGVANAHRVAVLEGGATWTDRKLTQRDMQFEQLRRLNRDTIMGAFGMPNSVMGVTENVNRANAEAGEVMFARWLVRPRLTRIMGALNKRLIEPVDPTLRMSFVDPVPQNRELLLEEATGAFKEQILTRNEARRRLGEPDLEDERGDEFASPSAGGGGFAAGFQRRTIVIRAVDPQELKPEADPAENFIEAGWVRRLALEADRLVAFLEELEGRSPESLLVTGKGVTKVEISDLGGFDWDWWTLYGDEVVDELSRAFSTILGAQLPDMPAEEVQRLAGEYANARGARLLRLDGDLNLMQETRRVVNQVVATSIEAGQSLAQLQIDLRENFAFSPARAARVARTETATALGQGSKRAALVQGRDEKAWITQGDLLVSQVVCAPNEAQGWIKVTDPFQSGHDTIPGHVNCFIPGTMVQGRFVGGLKAWYAGEVVNLVTAAGKRLTVTPNHPILTDQGFLSASAVRKGTNVVSYRGNGEGGAMLSQDKHEMPAMIEQVLETLRRGGRSVWIKTVSTYLHGDARGVEGDIEIVGADRVLAISSEADLDQAVAQLALTGPDVGLAIEARLGTGFSRGDAINATSARLPGSSELTLSRLATSTPAQALGLAPPTKWDVRRFQEPVDGGTADAQFLRELLDRYPGQVAFDQVIDIWKDEWTGHVYDLQAEGGWLLAGGIVTSNCRCVVRYRTSTQLESGAMHYVSGQTPAPQTALGPGHRVAELRCATCDRILARGVPAGESRYCRRCKTETVADGPADPGEYERTRTIERNDDGYMVAIHETVRRV